MIMCLPSLKGTVFFIYSCFKMVSFRGKKTLGHVQIGLGYGFNLKCPTSIPPHFIWESPAGFLRNLSCKWLDYQGPLLVIKLVWPTKRSMGV